MDTGWHQFLLYTREYRAFCDQVAGHFIHHVPEDEPGAPTHAKTPVMVRDTTVEAIQQAGYVVDPDLWTVEDYAPSCGSCHEDGNCTASGVDGNENTETRTG
ncbi:hypothetical protein [Saccharopolyspora thermophila]|uniref:Uncharacterized protein n=1 Tax=Saccharopolyspora thermophila TaxID=89367 RepID=A0ABP3MCY2_9PSEU